ncbi:MULTISPECIES: hypothetical protein [unclassified Rubrivivax]|uniref:hypothetical protein n=1 Tax=unclassified Rubrivivax TaxID=2649762 RepID=UPI001E2F40E9|nr:MULTISPECIES: hypothetical protein [unclassified Rubrivivax]MCC9597427.1 hypothetical protein [Rubrivivax sp. JA1055]MCC9646315.1 hypothetical protein [Rubrivivax sp. JA1029]
MPNTCPTPYHWLSADEVVRLALTAYHAACRNHDQWAAKHPEDAADDAANGDMGNRELAASVGEIFTYQLEHLGHTKGVPGFDGGCTEWMRRNPEYWGLTSEYVDNSPRNSAEKLAPPDIHCRCFGPIAAVGFRYIFSLRTSSPSLSACADTPFLRGLGFC